jgi:hypothetical protein
MLFTLTPPSWGFIYVSTRFLFRSLLQYVDDINITETQQCQ